MTGGLGSSCGACKFLRRRCASDCIFAPYFCHEQASTHFAAVHKVFGASNVSKLLLHLPVDRRGDAAITISYEALARMHDPVYGCVAHILALQQQVANLQEEIEFLENHIANHTIGFSNNYGISQSMSNNATHLPCNNQSYFTPPPPPPPPPPPTRTTNDVMNTIYYQNQQSSSGLLVNNVLGNCTNLSQAFDSQISSFQGWQDHQNSGIFESSLNHIFGILEGDDQDILSYYPRLDIIGNGTNIATI